MIILLSWLILGPTGLAPAPRTRPTAPRPGPITITITITITININITTAHCTSTWAAYKDRCVYYMHTYIYIYI